LLTGYIHPSYTIQIIDVIATIFIIIGVVLIGRQEQALFKQELHLSEDKRKHRFGALALFFPIIYTLIEAFSTAEISGINGNSGIVTAGAEASIPAIDFFIFECVGIALVSVCLWLYLAIVKKYTYNPFQPEEIIRCGAAIGETFGTMIFILAAAINSVLTAPITSLYCILTIVLARIFLKERLTKNQYVSLGILLIGIVLLGISEIIHV
jgi:drug/metabolite transporter (DMT)-like permease